MAKPRKLPSGNWTIKLYDYTDKDGKQIFKSITKETKADVLYHAGLFLKDKKEKKKTPNKITVSDAIDKYIELSSILSPTTLSSYDKIKKYAFQSIMDMPVSDLDDEIMQDAINEECKRKSEKTKKTVSAKTVKNEWGLIAAALGSVCKKRFDIKLPKIQHHIKDYPEPQAVINAIVGSSIELPCMLAIWLSFSMSEIRGLKCSDIKDGYITINRVKVDVDSVPTIKDNAKVETRIRKHKIPPYLQKLINNDEIYQNYLKTKTDAFLVPYSRDILYGRWQTICKANNFTLSFHDLRHMNASIMLMLNIPEKYAMERGGWKTPSVMKNVYQHTFTDQREAVDKTIDNYFKTLLPSSAAKGKQKQKRKQEP